MDGGLVTMEKKQYKHSSSPVLFGYDLVLYGDTMATSGGQMPT
jgi:hypothetical protein